MISNQGSIHETEPANKRNEQLFYRSLFSNSLDGILITDEDAIIKFSSPSVISILGFLAEDLEGQSAFDFVHPEDRKLALAAFLDEVVEQPQVKFISIRLKRKAGDWLWCIVRGHNLINVEHVKGMAIYFYDDTLRKKAKDELVESEKRFRYQANILANVTDVIITSDMERKITSINKVFQELAGIKEKEVLGKELRHCLDIHFSAISVDEAIATVFKEGIWKGELSFKKPNGETCYLLHTISLIYENKTPVGLLGVGKDITERKTAEEEFKTLIQNLSQGVVVQNAEGKVVVCNTAAQKILDVPLEEILGTSSGEKKWDVINEDGTPVPGDEHPASRAFKTRKPIRDVVMGVCRIKSGERVWLMVNADPTLDSGGKVVNVVVTFTDITEQKKLSKQLIDQEIHKQKSLTQATIDGQEKERLEMGKELHDNINQHLNTTRLYLEVAREKANGEVKEMINFSHKALAGIIDKIRFLSQSLVPPTLGDIGLVESIQDVCDSLKRTHKFRIDFVHRHFNEEGLPDNLLLMLFRITQEQVNNIIRHAEAKNIHIKLESDAESIILTIADDGKGFDPQNHKKGLGITNITNRASLFNGTVEINAARGKGCKLVVIIPTDQL
jgi:PAS domain S-box-containing protein